MKFKILYFLTTLGVLDTIYLSYEHYSGTIPPCPAHSVLGNFVDCGRVLTSSYASVFGIPVAVIGLVYYLFLFLAIWKLKKYLIYITGLALLGSVYFMYIQLFILNSICLYCMVSAVLNLVIFILTVPNSIKHKNSNNSANNAA